MVPVYLAVGANSGLNGIVALGVLSLLAPVAVFLSRTGRLVLAHALQTAIITAFVLWIMATSGDAMSPALLWLVVLPFEAAVTGSRRLVLTNMAVSVLVFSCIGLFQGGGSAAGIAVDFQWDPVLTAMNTRVAPFPRRRARRHGMCRMADFRNARRSEPERQE